MFRRLAFLEVLLLLVLAATVSLVVTAKPAHATSPPGGCNLSEDGDQQLDPNTGYFYECRCDWASNHTDIICVWVVIEDDSEEGLANSSLVSAELGYGGSYYAMLRARASSVGPWEQYSMGSSGYSSGTWAIRSLANNEYVAAELGYGGGDYAMLRARTATVIDSWEQFWVYQIGTGNDYALQSAANGLFVSTELGYGGSEYAMLRARSSAVGAWEQYSFGYLGGTRLLAHVQPGPDVATKPLPPKVGPAIAVAKRIPCPAEVQAAVGLTTQCHQLMPPMAT